ncbi:MAG: hypothetical protein ACR2NU_01850 [Aeoliella sp.]
MGLPSGDQCRIVALNQQKVGAADATIVDVLLWNQGILEIGASPGEATFGEFLIWMQQFGSDAERLAALSSSVPEPMTGMLAAMFVLGVAGGRGARTTF